MCIVRTFREFHANVAFPAIYTHFYQIGNIANIVWTLEKDIAEGWSGQLKGDHTKINICKNESYETSA